MIVKYVALLAFNKIVASHPHLISLHQDIILDCIDDPDITIRLRALDLVVGMISGDNLVYIVSRLMKQLRNAPNMPEDESTEVVRNSIEPSADFEEEDPEESLKPAQGDASLPPSLPIEYRIKVLQIILKICAAETYSRILDFTWYISMLLQLVQLVPDVAPGLTTTSLSEDSTTAIEDIPLAIGSELLNISVRVISVREEAVRAAETLLLADRKSNSLALKGHGRKSILRPVAWTTGEYADLLQDPEQVLSSLMHPSNLDLPALTLSIYLQAIVKIFVSMSGSSFWDSERRVMTTLRLARIIHFLEKLTSHPSLEVQERAVEFHELLRLATEALAENPEREMDSEAPLLLTHAVPSLFAGLELKPVAQDAQLKIPPPSEIDLDKPINQNLNMLLQASDYESSEMFQDEEDMDNFYYQSQATQIGTPTIPDDAKGVHTESASYQLDQALKSNLDPETAARRRNERLERNRDDPFYIHGNSISGTSTPIHDILQDSNGNTLDVETIPIMELDLAGHVFRELTQKRTQPKNIHRNVEIIKDEDIESNLETQTTNIVKKAGARNKGFLQVDSSGLQEFSLDGPDGEALAAAQRQQEDDAEMAKALKEVERLRLEMQRASERIQTAKGVPKEGTLVKKKKKKKAKALENEQDESQQTDNMSTIATGQPEEVVVKRKKKRKPKDRTLESSEGIPASPAE